MVSLQLWSASERCTMARPSEQSPSTLSRSSHSGVLDSRRWHMLSIYLTLGVLAVKNLHAFYFRLFANSWYTHFVEGFSLGTACWILWQLGRAFVTHALHAIDMDHNQMLHNFWRYLESDPLAQLCCHTRSNSLGLRPAHLDQRGFLRQSTRKSNQHNKSTWFEHRKPYKYISRFRVFSQDQATRFDIDERFVAYLAVLCNAVYVPSSWLCTWLLRSHGLAKVAREQEMLVGEKRPETLSPLMPMN